MTERLIIDLTTHGKCDDRSSVNDVEVTFQNVNLVNVNKLYEIVAKQKITSIKLEGSIEHFNIPSGVKTAECCELGLKTIHIPDSVEFLYCSGNELTNLELPCNILSLFADCNNIDKLTSRGALTRIESLFLRHNKISDFDLRLPPSMDLFFIGDNDPEVRVKYMAFLFPVQNDPIIIGGDFVNVLSDNNDLAMKEHIRGRLQIMCELGHEYINVRELHNDATWYRGDVRAFDY